MRIRRRHTLRVDRCSACGCWGVNVTCPSCRKRHNQGGATLTPYRILYLHVDGDVVRVRSLCRRDDAEGGRTVDIIRDWSYLTTHRESRRRLSRHLRLCGYEVPKTKRGLMNACRHIWAHCAVNAI